MKPQPAMVRAAILGVTAIFVLLWAWLLWDTWKATTKVEPSGAQLSLTPVVAGGLGLLFALSLGVDPSLGGAKGFRARLKALFTTDALLVVGATVYALAAVAGVFVWLHAGDKTPDLVTALVLVAAGYAVTAMTTIARG